MALVHEQREDGWRILSTQQTLAHDVDSTKPIMKKLYNSLSTDDINVNA